MSRFIDLAGKKFGRWTVIAYAGTIGNGRRKAATWQCRCDCGNNAIVRAHSLVQGKTQSCGCLREEKRLKASTSHGMKHSSTYESWKNMKGRCCNPNNQRFAYYGGRGIKVCDRWQKFENFYADMGEKPEGMTIERIDNNKGYSPENCCYATYKEQNRNQRTNRMITYFGETKCLAEWAEELSINYNTLQNRLKNYPPQIAFNM